MARKINRLAARFVSTTSEAGRHADGGGLYLVVEKPHPTTGAAGAKRWVFIYRRPHDGKQSELGLGGINAVDLATARMKASELRSMLVEGKDPKHERAAEIATIPTFGQMADQVIASLESGWKNDKHRAQWRTTLATHAADLTSVRVDEVTIEHVLAVLKPVWIEKAETASRLRGRIETVLNAAKARKFRTGENPAAWKGNLDHLLPARQKLQRGHHAAMAWEDLPEFVGLLRARQGLAALALEFTILTAARSGEVRGARWSEIDVKSSLWLVPAARMKAGREHRVPLSGRAIQILKLSEEFERPDGLIFPGTVPGSPLSDMTLSAVLRRMKLDAITVHGFRSTFRDWAAETTNFPNEVVEMALAHAVGNKVEAAYRRGDLLEKRRELMQAWANYCEPVKAANVVNLPINRSA